MYVYNAGRALGKNVGSYYQDIYLPRQHRLVIVPQHQILVWKKKELLRDNPVIIALSMGVYIKFYVDHYYVCCHCSTTTDPLPVLPTYLPCQCHW